MRNVLLLMIACAALNAGAQTKLMVRNVTGKIVNVGQPPWAGADTVTNFTVIDIGNQAVPTDFRNYFYLNGEFVFDNTDSLQTATTFNQIKTIAQSAVGIQLQNLTTTQIRGLMAVLLWKADGVDKATLTVKPLNQWVK